MRVDRRGVLLVLATVVAVALVGLAARGDQGDTGDPALTLAPGTGQAASTIVLWLLALVGIGLLLLLPFALGGGGPRKERKKKSRLGQVIALVLVALVLWFAGDLRPPTSPPPDGVATLDDGERAAAPEEEDPPPSPFGTLLLAGLGALAVAGVAALVVRARLRRDGALVVPDVEERVLVPAGAPGQALAERAAAEPDPRQAVLLAFAAAEERLGRPPATSPREWLASVRSEPLAVLVGRYEVARFSHHDVTEADRRAALDALAALP